jgi:hypothetical protein
MSYGEAQRLLTKQFEDLKKHLPGVSNAVVLTQLIPQIDIKWDRKYPNDPLMYEVRLMVTPKPGAMKC